MDYNLTYNGTNYCASPQFTAYLLNMTIIGINGNPIFTSTIPIAAIAACVNFVFIVFSIMGMRRHFLAKKLYVFLINRALSDMLSSLSIAFGLGYAQGFTMLIIGLGGVNLTFLAATGSYLALSLLKLLAIFKPFYYRTHVTVARCFRPIASTWICSFILSSTATTFMYMSLNNRFPSCNFSRCVLPIWNLTSYINIICYFITLFSYCLTMAFVYKRSGSRTGKGLGNYWKIAANVDMFIVINLPAAALQLYSGIIVGRMCHGNSDLTVLEKIPTLMGWSIVLISLRAMIDPVLGALIDNKFRSMIFR